MSFAIEKQPGMEKINKVDLLLFEIVEGMSECKLSLNPLKAQLLHFFGCTAGYLIKGSQTSESSTTVSYLDIIVNNYIGADKSSQTRFAR